MNLRLAIPTYLKPTGIPSSNTAISTDVSAITTNAACVEGLLQFTMRLINVDTYELESFDVQPVTEATKQKLGWSKIEYSCQQARKDGCKYAWVDTCCIDKSSSAELSEAIDSMFDGYQQARICYVYMADVVYHEVTGGLGSQVAALGRADEQLSPFERPQSYNNESGDEAHLPESNRPYGIQAMCSVGSILLGSETTFLLALDCYDERMPTHVLTLAMKDADPTYGLSVGRNVKVLEPSDSWDRLRLLQQPHKLIRRDLTLLYDDIALSPSTIPSHTFHLLETSPRQKHSLKITHGFPRHHWNLDTLTYDERQVDTSKGRDVGGFLFTVEPRTLEPGLQHSRSTERWTIDVAWRHSYNATSPDRFSVRCSALVNGTQQTHSHSPEFAHPCPTCSADKCRFFRPLKFSEDRYDTLILQGLGGNEQLRFQRKFNSSKEARELRIFKETTPSSASLSLSSLYLRAKHIGSIYANITSLGPDGLGFLRQVVLPPKTQIRSKHHWATYLDYERKWARDATGG